MQSPPSFQPVPSGVDYSVIIPCFNEEACLPATIQRLRASMAQQERWRGEIILVDNASTDGSAQIARQLGARVIAEAKRQIARARNTGAAASLGRFLIFVDADTLISEQLLAGTLHALTEGHICGGGTRIGFIPGELGAPHPAGRALGNVFSYAVYSCGLWGGAYTFCRVDAFAGAGGFDETLYAAEDVAFARSLKKWARRQGERTRVLPYPMQTSLRKAQWFSAAMMARTLMRFLFRPSLLRDPAQCSFWYVRPQA